MVDLSDIINRYNQIIDTTQTKIKVLQFIQTLELEDEDIDIRANDFHIKLKYKNIYIDLKNRIINVTLDNTEIIEFYTEQINQEYLDILEKVISEIDKGNLRSTEDELNQKILFDQNFAKIVIPKLIRNELIVDDIRKYYSELVCPIHDTLHYSSWCLKKKLEEC